MNQEHEPATAMRSLPTGCPLLVPIPDLGPDPVLGMSRSWWFAAERRKLINLVRPQLPGRGRSKTLLPVAEGYDLLRKLSDAATRSPRTPGSGLRKRKPPANAPGVDLDGFLGRPWPVTLRMEILEAKLGAMRSRRESVKVADASFRLVVRADGFTGEVFMKPLPDVDLAPGMIVTGSVNAHVRAKRGPAGEVLKGRDYERPAMLIVTNAAVETPAVPTAPSA